MYQEWESPSFTIEQLTEFCREFFESNRFSTDVERRREDRARITVEISPINERHTLTVERKGSRLKLTFPPLSRTSYDLARLGSIFVTGWGLRNAAEKELFLDRLEQQFWENLDRRLAAFREQGYGNLDGALGEP